MWVHKASFHTFTVSAITKHQQSGPVDLICNLYPALTNIGFSNMPETGWPYPTLAGPATPHTPP